MGRTHFKIDCLGSNVALDVRQRSKRPLAMGFEVTERVPDAAKSNYFINFLELQCRLRPSRDIVSSNNIGGLFERPNDNRFLSFVPSSCFAVCSIAVSLCIVLVPRQITFVCNSCGFFDFVSSYIRFFRHFLIVRLVPSCLILGLFCRARLFLSHFAPSHFTSPSKQILKK